MLRLAIILFIIFMTFTGTLNAGGSLPTLVLLGCLSLMVLSATLARIRRQE